VGAPGSRRIQRALLGEKRAYRYVLLNHPVRPAADSGRVGWYHAPLDVEHMRAAASLLVGEHDFSSFRFRRVSGEIAVRTLMKLEITQQGAYILFDLRANGFLHHMVRNIVGSLVYVGKGKHDPSWGGELLATRDRRLAAPTFDAAGLYLTGVEYDPVWGLPRAPRAALPHFALAEA
jgi:tRNA pseudouridine38-40 synthase